MAVLNTPLLAAGYFIHQFIEGLHGKTTLLSSEFFNHGTVRSFSGPLHINVSRGENHNSISSGGQGGITFTIDEFFTNFQEKEIKSEDFVAIKGGGSFQNDALIKSASSIS